MQRNVVVLPYDNNWKTEFDKIKSELLAAFGDFVLSIEHVGSTSVIGLYAKPIIDIDIVVENDKFELVKNNLEVIGYSYEGDLGIAGREAFKYSEKLHLMEHHLYVCAKDAAELKRHIMFRDYLRTHDTDRDKYSEIKIEMAKNFPHDIDNYINGKQHFILGIYKKCGL
jgi:GrpB-like predicted nucleotidyltransferase (UPF0157 family)